jgi:hypothetical protein
MNDIDLQTATSRLYEDISLREELGDDSAEVVLNWGEKQLPRIVESSPDEATFDEQFHTLRRVMKIINRMVSGRADGDMEKQNKRLSALMERAAEAGFNPQVTPDVFVSQSADMNESDAVKSLLQLIAPETMIEPETPAASIAEEQPDDEPSQDRPLPPSGDITMTE